MAQMLFHELRPFLAEAQAADLPVTLGEKTLKVLTCSLILTQSPLLSLLPISVRAFAQ